MFNKQNPINPVFPFNSRWVIKDMPFCEWLNYLQRWQHIGHGAFVKKDVEVLTGTLLWPEKKMPKPHVNYRINPNYSGGHQISKSWFDESQHVTDSADYFLHACFAKTCLGVHGKPCLKGLDQDGNICERCKGIGYER